MTPISIDVYARSGQVVAILEGTYSVQLLFTPQVAAQFARELQAAVDGARTHGLVRMASLTGSYDADGREVES